MKHLYFVRHGLSVMNKAGFFSGRTNTPLADEGREQARQAGTIAKAYNIDLIVSSPMERALETAHIIAQEIGYPIEKIITNDLFIERAFGSLEGTPYRPGADLDGIEGVESSLEIVERARQAINLLKNLPAENILIVSHGATGRALYHVLNPEVPFMKVERFNNAEIAQLI